MGKPLTSDEQASALMRQCIALRQEREELIAALRSNIDDLTETYEALTTGVPVVSIGQWSRLRRSMELLARLAPKVS